MQSALHGPSVILQLTPDQQLFGSLLFAVIVATLDHLHQGKPLLNPFFKEKRITKVTRPVWKVFVCAFIGMGVAYLVTLIGYAPTTNMQALFTGILVIPVTHAGRLSQIANKITKNDESVG